MHIECLKARDDINAVVHTHPNYSIAYASQDEFLKPFTPDMILLLGTEIPVIKFFCQEVWSLQERLLEL